MYKLFLALIILIGNFVAQSLYETPNYSIAFERCFFQAFAMLAITWIPVLAEKGAKL